MMALHTCTSAAVQVGIDLPDASTVQRSTAQGDPDGLCVWLNSLAAICSVDSCTNVRCQALRTPRRGMIEWVMFAGSLATGSMLQLSTDARRGKIERVMFAGSLATAACRSSVRKHCRGKAACVRWNGWMQPAMTLRKKPIAAKPPPMATNRMSTNSRAKASCKGPPGLTLMVHCRPENTPHLVVCWELTVVRP